MILLGKKDLKNRNALMCRKQYVQSLLDNPGVSDASPSSQEWVNPEFASAQQQRLKEEIREINALLKKVKP